MFFLFSGLRVSVSNVSGASQWRKESVTIIESQEPMEEDGEENEGDVESDGVEREEKEEAGPESQFLSVPSQSITASSSAETLTDNTITAPSTPTPVTASEGPPDIKPKTVSVLSLHCCLSCTDSVSRRAVWGYPGYSPRTTHSRASPRWSPHHHHQSWIRR